MKPLETQDECIQRLTRNKISSLPKTENTYQAPAIVKCTKRKASKFSVDFSFFSNWIKMSLRLFKLRGDIKRGNILF